MITDDEKKLAEQTIDEQQDELERARRHYYEIRERRSLGAILEGAAAFASTDTTHSQKLEHCIRVAAEKLRMGDLAGALLTLEKGMQL